MAGQAGGPMRGDVPAAVLDPLIVDPADMRWDQEADVVVVGFGGAGACAAIEAREQGASVIAIDRFAGGGATAFSGGIIYAGGTRHQRDAGFDDDAGQMYDYLSAEVGDVVSPATLRRYCDESAANLTWLEGHGVPYSSEAYVEKTLYPPDGKYLYYAGNEKMPEHAARARPAPRGHRPVGAGLTGHVYFAALARAAAGLGVKLAQQQRAVRLIMDRGGRVIGVEVAQLADSAKGQHQRLYDKVVPMLPLKAVLAERSSAAARKLEEAHSIVRRIGARRGVVLATGGFAMNLDMLRAHQPFYADNFRALMRLGSLGCDGSGIMLGQTAGGETGRMSNLYAARNMAPPNALLEGMLVNPAGKRFINEEAYSGHLGLAIAAQEGGKAWLILRADSFWQAVRQSLFGGFLFFKYYGVPALLNFALGGTRRGATLGKLARKCGIDPAGLERSATEADTELRAGLADPFGKAMAMRKLFGQGPFYAVNMSIPNIYAFTYMFTLGGLRVDEDSGAVLRADGTAIAGLYAAGRAAVGLCSNGYLSGLSIGDGVFSGRRAGRAAANAGA